MYNDARTGSSDPGQLSRRGVLLTGGALLVATTISGCSVLGSGEADALIQLAESAENDAARADTIARAFPALTAAGAMARARREQGLALRKEIARSAGDAAPREPRAGTSAASTPTGEDDAAGQLIASLRQAQAAAATLVPTCPTYRAGLLASVAAGCAGLQELFR